MLEHHHHHHHHQVASSGTLPAWLTFGWALIVGTFTIIGILTALRSYRKSVKGTHEAQARLVYAQLVKVEFLKKGSPSIQMPGGSIYSGHRLIDEHGKLILSLENDLAFVTLRVVNKSKELIGEVRGTVIDHAAGKQPVADVRIFTDVVDPEDSYEYTVGVLDRWHGGYSLTPRVQFRDSSGNLWQRDGSEPVKEITAHWWEKEKRRNIKAGILIA